MTDNPAGLDLRLEAVDGPTATVCVAGELDLVTAPPFGEQLAGMCDEGTRHLTLDLGGLSFIDSSGLSALVSALKHYRAAGGDVVLRSPTPATAKVLEISGLNRVFTVLDTADG